MSNQDPINVGEDFLADALGEGAEQERDEFVAPPPQAPQRGGYAPLIEQKRKEMRELEAKVENPQASYSREGQDGQQPYFDYVQMQVDAVRINKLSREIDELRERERRGQSELSQRNRTAVEVARSVISQELPRLPEHLRAAVKESFAQMFKLLSESGEWGKSAYADRENMRKGLMQMVDTAVGQAHRKVEYGGTTPSGSEPGQPGQPKSSEPEEDDFTNNLMYAFEQRRRGSMTFAEAKKAAQAAETGGKA